MYGTCRTGAYYVVIKESPKAFIPFIPVMVAVIIALLLVEVKVHCIVLLCR